MAAMVTAKVLYPCSLLQDPSLVMLQTPRAPSAAPCLFSGSLMLTRKVRTAGPMGHVWVEHRHGQGAHACQAHAWTLSCTRVGDQCCPPCPGWPVGGPVIAHPTLHAGQVPPEDDEYEYSEYSVEDYQDPEASWGGDGENGGWIQGDLGRGRRSWSLLTSH